MTETNLKIKKQVIYKMECNTGYYESDSWFRLGYMILSHRLWHLFKHKRWMD